MYCEPVGADAAGSGALLGHVCRCLPALLLSLPDRAGGRVGVLARAGRAGATAERAVDEGVAGVSLALAAFRLGRSGGRNQYTSDTRSPTHQRGAG